MTTRYIGGEGAWSPAYGTSPFYKVCYVFWFLLFSKLHTLAWSYTRSSKQAWSHVFFYLRSLPSFKIFK